MNYPRLSITALAVWALSTPLCAAEVTVENAWVRGTVAAQRASGAFMRLTAHVPMQLVGAASPVAGVAEVHRMAMEGEVMKMRPVDFLELPAGTPVELEPGGYHIMLMRLRKPLDAGTTVPITLRLRAADGAEQEVRIDAPVRALTDRGPMHGH